MGFLRRLLSRDPAPEASPPEPLDAAAADVDERRHELEVLRSEQERLDDLAQRQLRYAEHSWTPPRQGGERRADDADEGR